MRGLMSHYKHNYIPRDLRLFIFTLVDLRDHKSAYKPTGYVSMKIKILEFTFFLLYMNNCYFGCDK